MAKPRSGRPEHLLLAVGALVLAALLYNLWLQARSVPPALRYVPEDSTLWIATGPLDDVWQGARPHLAGYFDSAVPAEGEDTPMRAWARGVRERLDKSRITLAGPEDLPALGIDPSAGVAMAALRRGRSSAVFVVPVLDRTRFLDAVQRFNDEPPQPAGGDGPPILRVGGGMFLGFGDDGAAVFADDETVLRDVLARQDAQLAHHRSLDRDARLFGQLLDRAASPAWLRGRARDGGLPLPLIGEFHFSLELQAQALRLQARAPLPVGRSATLARVLAPPPPAGERGHAALERSEGAVVLADAAWPEFVRLLAADPALRRTSGIEQTFPALLQQLRSTRTLRRISAATIETRQRVPGVLLGLEVSPEDADAIVLGAQVALRVKRDRELLQAAWSRLPVAPATAEAVVAAGMLTTRDDPLWARYRGEPDRAEAQPALEAADFSGSTYTVKRPNGSPLRFLMPPVTRDDLAFRLTGDDDAAPLRSEELLADRYRMCSVYADGTLWVATDAGVLENWLARLQREPAASDFADAARPLPRAAEAKLLALALPRRLLAAAELHPDPKVGAERRAWLADLDAYRALLLAVSTDPDGRELHVDAHLVRH